MLFTGRIYRIYPVQSGTSANGNEWSRQDFIFEYFENPTNRYADRVLLSVMNDRIKEYDLHEGEECIIGFAHTTREYQGRCFNDIRVYHFEKVKQVGFSEGAGPAAKPQGTVEQQTAQQTQGQLFPPQQTTQQAQLFPQNPTLGPGYQNGQTPTAPATPQPTQQGNEDLPF